LLKRWQAIKARIVSDSEKSSSIMGEGEKLGATKHLSDYSLYSYPQRGEEFFELFSRISALSKEAKKQGQALAFFRKSREILEDRLKKCYETKSRREDALSLLPCYHSLLALVLWLYPNHIGFNKAKQASLIFQNAVAAVTTSGPRRDMPFALGLAIQLRILPFLVRAKKVHEDRLHETRKIALDIIGKFETRDQPLSTIEENSSHSSFPVTSLSYNPADRTQVPEAGMLGIIYDGLGFSYYQFERNRERSIAFLKRATSLISQELRYLARTARSSKQRKTSGKWRRKNLATVFPHYLFYKCYAPVPEMALGLCHEYLAENVEGEEMIVRVRTSRFHYKRAYELAKKTPWHVYKAMIAYNLAGTYWRESEYQSDKRKVIDLLKKAVSIGEESLRWATLWTPFERDILGGSWIASFYQALARHSRPKDQRRLMARSIALAKRAQEQLKRGGFAASRYDAVNIGDVFYHTSEYYRDAASKAVESEIGISSQSSRFSREKVRQESEETKSRRSILTKSLEFAAKSLKFYKEERYEKRAVDARLLASAVCHELEKFKESQSNSSPYGRMAKHHLSKALKLCQKNNWNEKLAESYWLTGQILDVEGDFLGSASFFSKACEAYEAARVASENSRVYQGFANFMQALNKIELAKEAHRSSNFELASKSYAEAAKFVALSRRWEHRAPVLRAESVIEEAERASSSEDFESSLNSFRKAIEILTRFKEDVGSQKGWSEDIDELERQSDVLIKFCKARIMLETSKHAYQVGNLEQSISELKSAEEMFLSLASNSAISSDPLKASELRTLASLCIALSAFQRAQQENNPGLYVKARKIFEGAAETSSSKYLRALLLGLSNFASFLYSSTSLESSLEGSFDVQKVIECNKSLDRSELMFRRVGNRSFLNLLRASKHILDATIKMSAAEREIENPELKASLYSQAQKSLSYASRYYESLGASKRVREALKMVTAVRNHQRLLPLAHDIIAEVASSQIIYSTISTSSLLDQTPSSAGRAAGSAFIALDVEIPQSYLTTDEEFSYYIYLSNLGLKPAVAFRMDEVAPEGFEIVKAPYPIIAGRSLKLNLRIDPSSEKKIALQLRPLSSGDFVWHPSLIYLDEGRNYRATKPQTVRAVIESPGLNLEVALQEKEKLEIELRKFSKKLGEVSNKGIGMGQLNYSEEYYSLKEKISAIDEMIARTKNEYQSLQSELEKIRSDILSLRQSGREDPESEAQRTDLEFQERLILAKLERRKRQLEQAHLL
jgi:hypothetical protein